MQGVTDILGESRRWQMVRNRHRRDCYKCWLTWSGLRACGGGSIVLNGEVSLDLSIVVVEVAVRVGRPIKWSCCKNSSRNCG
jgi:hypothetical protein